jgi:TusA-related sulfurtransferase
LVSATLLDFSDSDLKKLPVYDLEVYTPKLDELGQNIVKEREALEIRTFGKEDPHVGIANLVADYFDKSSIAEDDVKFFIGINSFAGINEIIEVLEKRKVKASISVLVSSDSKENFYKKYNQKEIENGILPSNINLTTCINWSGIDINEKIYPIAISLKTKVHHAFSFENLVQFFGRSRIKEGKPPLTFALKLSGGIDYEKPKVSLNTRKKQLEGLIDYLETKIDEPSDKFHLIEAISKTKSSLIYLNSDNKPAVNWLLEDLEKHELIKVEDYDDNAYSLVSKLNHRYEIRFLDYPSFSLVRPDRKSAEEKEVETLERFLDNLNEEYESINLADRFLNVEKLQSIRVAAYWYLFGRSFQMSEGKCKELAERFSKYSKPFQISSIVVAGLRFYVRYKNAFDKLIGELYEKRNKQKNLKSSEILEVISNVSGGKKHFEVIFDSENQSEGVSLLMQYFFGIEKIGGTNPKFKIFDNQLDIPELINQCPNLGDLLLEVSNHPVTNGITITLFKRENVIDSIFLNS